jgi:hypothetical protein
MRLQSLVKLGTCVKSVSPLTLAIFSKCFFFAKLAGKKSPDLSTAFSKLDQTDKKSNHTSKGIAPDQVYRCHGDFAQWVGSLHNITNRIVLVAPLVLRHFGWSVGPAHRL